MCEPGIIQILAISYFSRTPNSRNRCNCLLPEDANTTKMKLPYSEKIWRGFNLAQGKNGIFGADLIWRF